MIAVPALTPVTNPVEAFTVATAVALLLHIPPVSPLLVYVTALGAPIQIGVAPLTVPAFAFGLTVTNCDVVAVQPFASFTITLYVVLAVNAGVVNVAVELNPVPQSYIVPPVPVRVVVVPVQIVVVPVIPAVGNGFTVTTAVPEFPEPTFIFASVTDTNV